MSEPQREGAFLEEATPSEIGLVAASIVLGVVAGARRRSVTEGVLAVPAACFILSILYAIVAGIFGWRRPRGWMLLLLLLCFVGDI